MRSIDGATSSIRSPVTQAVTTHFEIKSTIVRMIQNTVQFNRLSHEDPNYYIANFLEQSIRRCHSPQVISFLLKRKSKKNVETILHQILLQHGRSWFRISQQNTSHQPKLPSLGTTSPHLSNGRMNLYMGCGNILKTYLRSSIIMTFSFGYKNKLFIMV